MNEPMFKGARPASTWSLGLVVILVLSVLGQGTANAQPVIRSTQSPQSVVVVAGSPAALTVSATGISPLTYQWYFNGTNLSFVTNRTISFTKAAATNDGDYFAVVTNAYGAATSSVARLSVIPPPTQLLARALTNGTPRLPYRLFVPTNYTASQEYPLVLFMHGAGEVGTDNLMQLSVNPQVLAFVSYGRQAISPALLAAPQCPSDRVWYDPIMRGRVSDLLDDLTKEFSIDTNRIYITGLSLGGMGTWSLLDTTPTRFAAAIPVCGADTNEAICYQYAQVPIWNFHAANDSTVPVSYSRSMVNALRRAGSPVLYTEYASGGHGIWAQAYATPGLAEWAFAQTRGSPIVGGPRVVIDQATNLCSRIMTAGLLRLSGTAVFETEPISTVSWTNLLKLAGGTAMGSNVWSIAALPLVSWSTNTLIITAASSSRAPSNGGSTTFATALALRAGPPLQLQLELSTAGIRLRAPGVNTPVILQTKTILTGSVWEETEWTPTTALELPITDNLRFFRLVEE